MGRSRRDETKSLPITKGMVYDAYKKVKGKGKSAGVDGMSMTELESDLGRHLYKLWNRLTSGSYHPPAVRRVDIQKKDGGKRPLGIPTVLDRIAQMVIKDKVEPVYEQEFHPNSYGYRPGRSQHDALKLTSKRIWQYDWVLDMDIKGYFGAIDHEKLMKAVRKHNEEDWISMYIERWLQAPIQHAEGQKEHPKSGTPQGGVISPLLANLYLHYTFDKWMNKRGLGNRFERYADDIIVHCQSEQEANDLLASIRVRMAECGLQLHPKKTKIVYCGKQKLQTDKDYPRKFTFLGYEFKPGRNYSSKQERAFTRMRGYPSKDSKKRMIEEFKTTIKRGSPGATLSTWSEILNQKLSSWLNYYSLFDAKALSKEMLLLNLRLVNWLRNQYKRFKRSRRKAGRWLKNYCKHNPNEFSHWSHGFPP